MFLVAHCGIHTYVPVCLSPKKYEFSFPAPAAPAGDSFTVAVTARLHFDNGDGWMVGMHRFLPEGGAGLQYVGDLSGK